MADIFEVMRQRIKAMEKEIDTSKLKSGEFSFLFSRS